MVKESEIGLSRQNQSREKNKNALFVKELVSKD